MHMYLPRTSVVVCNIFPLISTLTFSVTRHSRSSRQPPSVRPPVLHYVDDFCIQFSFNLYPIFECLHSLYCPCNKSLRQVELTFFVFFSIMFIYRSSFTLLHSPRLLCTLTILSSAVAHIYQRHQGGFSVRSSTSNIV